MGDTQPSPDMRLFISHVHFLVVSVSHSVKEIKVKPFGNVDCITCDVLNARLLINIMGKEQLNLSNVNKAIVPQPGGDLTRTHACLPLGLDFTDFHFGVVVLCDTAALLR
jgi:hypothetical protein